MLCSRAEERGEKAKKHKETLQVAYFMKAKAVGVLFFQYLPVTSEDFR